MDVCSGEQTHRFLLNVHDDDTVGSKGVMMSNGCLKSPIQCSQAATKEKASLCTTSLPALGAIDVLKGLGPLVGLCHYLTTLAPVSLMTNKTTPLSVRASGTFLFPLPLTVDVTFRVSALMSMLRDCKPHPLPLLLVRANITAT